MITDDYNKKLEEEKVKIENELKDLNSDLAIDYLTLEQAAKAKYDKEISLYEEIDELIDKICVINRFYNYKNRLDIDGNKEDYKSDLFQKMLELKELKKMTVEDYYESIKGKRTKKKYILEPTINEKNVSEINRLINENPEYLTELIEDIIKCYNCFKHFKYMSDIGKVFGEKYNLRCFAYFGLKSGMNSFDITKKKIQEVKNEKLLSYYNSIAINKFLSVHNKERQLDLEGYKDVLSLARLFDLDKQEIQNLNSVINRKENESFIQKLFSKTDPFIRNMIDDIKNKILIEYSQPYLADQKLYELFVNAIDSVDKDKENNNFKLLKEVNNFEYKLKQLLNEVTYQIVALEQYEIDMINPMRDKINSKYSYLNDPVEFFGVFKTNDANEIISNLVKLIKTIEKKNIIVQRTEEIKLNSELETNEIIKNSKFSPTLTSYLSSAKVKKL